MKKPTKSELKKVAVLKEVMETSWFFAFIKDEDTENWLQGVSDTWFKSLHPKAIKKVEKGLLRFVRQVEANLKN